MPHPPTEASVWSAVDVLPGVPDLDADTAAAVMELPDTGFGAMIAWVIGPAHVRRAVDGQEHITRVRCTDKDGTTSYERPRTPQEQDELDADVDAYLHDGGLPPRPRGYRWFLTLPTGHTKSDFWNVLNGGLAQSTRTGHPSDTLLDMREILAQLYRQT